MNKISKIGRFTVLALLLTTANAFCRIPDQTQEVPAASPAASFSKILNGSAAQRAFGYVRARTFKHLAKSNALGSFTTFALNNGPLFAKWQVICSDFAQELTKTMPIEDILKNLGVTKATLTTVPVKTLPDTPEDNAAKDSVITAILKNSKFNALASLLSMGIGYVTSFVYTRSQVENPEHSTECLMQSALRVSLKKNLTLAQLKALQAFSDTVAFAVIVDNFEELKTLFIEELINADPSIVETLADHLAALKTN